MHISRYQYETGPRIRGVQTQHEGQPNVQQAHYDYEGFGRLKPNKEGAGPTAAPHAMAQAAEFDPQGRTQSDGRWRYTYTTGGQVETVSDQSGGLIARYAYNGRHQRVRKTANGRTTYYLWQHDKLVAEIDPQGAIHAQYLYFADGQRSEPIAKLQGDETYFIHNDHRATPLAMTNGRQQTVWRARHTAAGWSQVSLVGGEHAELNIRMPGQYFDAETGLHDNWHRTYNPQNGRYLQPDPLGYVDGPNPYLYARGDPVNKSDSTGLYQEDMHYYMTFFLALAAGMSYETAHITALASQYVDNNPITRPVDDENTLKLLASPTKNQQQLLWYHFTLSGEDGRNLSAYDNADTSSVVDHLSPQLQNLLNASNLGNPEQPCARYQFLGEFLHAYADTFSHRDKTNRPYDALSLGLGTGHGIAGSEPDYTYDDADPSNGTDPAIMSRLWLNREARTLEAERAIFSRLQQYGSGGLSFDAIQGVLVRFNRIAEHGLGATEKRKLLENTLNEEMLLGNLRLVDAKGNKLRTIDLREPKLQGYNADIARDNRAKFLGNLVGQEKTYPGVCLPGSEVCKEVKF